MTISADRERIVSDFLTLAKMDSTSFHEEQVLNWLKKELQTMGLQVREDDAGSRYGALTGNLYGILPATGCGGRPVLFSAHMDTVEPGQGKKPRYNPEEGVITSDGSTVLGADDVCGIVEILEGLRIAAAQPDGHGDIEVLFTIAEEVYGKGSSAFDYSILKSTDAYVLDMSGAVGRAARKAPSIVSFTADITGRASHAGFRPEEGINALQAAALAVMRIPQGKIAEQTTMNIGTIHGGTADNIVPEHCRITGECRSFDHAEALAAVESAEQAILSSAESIGAKAETNHTVQIQAYETPEEADVCRDFQTACGRLGLEGSLVFTHGGSDNNVFARHGVQGIVLSCGMFQTHSTGEYARIDEMLRGAQLVAEIISERRYEG